MIHSCESVGCKNETLEYNGLEAWLCDEHYELYRFVINAINASFKLSKKIEQEGKDVSTLSILEARRRERDG